MTNSIFQGKQHRDLEEQAIAAAQSLRLKVPDLLRIGLAWVLDQIENGGGLALSPGGAPRPVAGGPRPRKEPPSFLTPQTLQRLKDVDEALEGYLEVRFQDFLEMAITEDWPEAFKTPFLPGEVTYSQFVRLDRLRKRWISEREGNGLADVMEKGLTDQPAKPRKKKRPHPLFGEMPSERGKAA